MRHHYPLIRPNPKYFRQIRMKINVQCFPINPLKFFRFKSNLSPEAVFNLTLSLEKNWWENLGRGRIFFARIFSETSIRLAFYPSGVQADLAILFNIYPRWISFNSKRCFITSAMIWDKRNLDKRNRFKINFISLGSNLLTLSTTVAISTNYCDKFDIHEFTWTLGRPLWIFFATTVAKGSWKTAKATRSFINNNRRATAMGTVKTFWSKM